MITCLNVNTSLARKNVLRDHTTSQAELQAMSRQLGQDLGDRISSELLVAEREFTTASSNNVSDLFFTHATTVVISTKGDFELFGFGVADRLRRSVRGYMNFDGIQGEQALNAQVREIVLPDVSGPVDLLVVSKAVLATGCTAIGLARTAFTKYMPKHLVVASIFYTPAGLNEVRGHLPSADIFLVGQPDRLNDDGTMHPGFGYFDGRLHA